MATIGEEQVEPLKYKKWVLKVSIHCEGCKKKVKKVLQNIDGVYTVEVDSKKHKVVVTCNVDVEVLLRKLAKAHKNAEIWPEEPNPNPTNTSDNAKNVKKNSTESDTKKEKPRVEDVKPNEEGKNKDKKPTRNEEKDNKDNKEEKCITEKPISEKKVEKLIDTEKEANENPNSIVIEKIDNNESKNSKNEKRTENKFDNKSKQKENEPQQEAIPHQIPRNPTQLFQQYTTPYQPIPEPSYVVSYNMVSPSTSYSYYAPMSMQHEVLQQGYSYPMSTYQHEGFYPHYPPPLPPVGVTLPPPDDGSYNVFSDENANACKLM